MATLAVNKGVAENCFWPVTIWLPLSVTAVPITAPAFILPADIPAPDMFGGELHVFVPPIVWVFDKSQKLVLLIDVEAIEVAGKLSKPVKVVVLAAKV